MGIKASLGKVFAAKIAKKTQKWARRPVETQEEVLAQLIAKAKDTAFGKDHNYDSIKTYEDFKANVPVRDYEDLRAYVERVVAGEKDVLWPDAPVYFAKTSGTTSGAKYIPLTKESMPCHINAARNALLSYIHETGDSSFVNGKMIFLQGSPVLDKSSKVHTGRLSGIAANYVPNYLQKNRMPTYETNCIEDWETKVNAIVEETIDADMRLISGIPSWVQMYFEKILEKGEKEKVMEVFKNFSLFVYGGVNYEPYRSKFEHIIGKSIPSIETYPASEGFIAYQDSQTEKGLLLLLDNGMFYEFIPSDKFFEENPPRLSIGEVELGVNYVLILNTNAGLWGYNIGDTVKFVSKAPYRIVVTGRIKHYISAFGEHVIGEEVDNAMHTATKATGAQIAEFTVAPQVNPTEGLPFHEWFIEFEKEPADMAAFTTILNDSMISQNAYYKDAMVGKVLRDLIVFKVEKGGFIKYMKSIGKLGGQNKIPRLANDRKIVDQLKH
ncbi:MAG: phenylacetate-coenzyme A ligase PaaK-like adenylate-forming protein [Candidatus Azotimanducaceae bacterium]|jgi:phenylacetate-coenzyme A ligase PaaK-like adenylate-forming protein